MLNKFISLLFNLPIFEDHRKVLLAEATIRGSKDAFEKAHADIRETMTDDLEKRAEELMALRMSELLTIVDERAVVTFNQKNGLIYIGGELADQSRLNSLRAEAEFILQSDLWRIIQESPKALAERAMFIEGDSIDHLKKGRSMLYLLSVQKNIVDTFKNLQPKA